MNNARKTLNVFLATQLQTALPGWSFLTGDEQNPIIGPKSVSIQWLDGDSESTLLPGGRMRLAQVEVFLSNQDTSGAEAACEAVLKVLGLYTGTFPMTLVPKRDYSAGAPGVDTGSNLVLRRQLGKGWVRLPPPQQDARLYILTLQVDYLPD